MDVSLGVSIEGERARLSLLDAAPPHSVVDQSELSLQQTPVATLVTTVTATSDVLAQQGHRLVGTTICDPDRIRAAELASKLSDWGLTDVLVIQRNDAMTALAQSLVGDSTVATLSSDDDTAALTIVDAAADTTSVIAIEPVTDGDPGAAFHSLLRRFSEEPGGATSVIVLGSALDAAATTQLSAASPVPLTFAEHPEFGVARGTALAGLVTQGRPNATAATDTFAATGTMLGPQAQHLAYSEVDDSAAAWDGSDLPLQTPLDPLSSISPTAYHIDEEEETGPAAGQSKALLVGSSLVALVVIGFAALAVSVAINIRPDVDRQVARAYEESVAGKYFPPAPGQGVIPDGPAWTVVEHLPPPGTDPDARVLEPQLRGPGGNQGSSGELIQLYKDGTVGVEPIQKASAIIPMPAPGMPLGAAPAAVSPVSDSVARLVANLGQWSPCQVLQLVANINDMQQTISDRHTAFWNYMQVLRDQKKATSTRGPASGERPISLTDIGPVVLVPKDKGVLFETSKEAGITGVDTSAIPSELFATNETRSNAAAVLPVDAKLVTPSELSSSNVKPSSTLPIVPSLGEIVPQSTVDTLPGIQGTAPPVVKTPDTTSDSPTEAVPGPGVKPGIKVQEQKPGTGNDRGSVPEQAPPATDPKAEVEAPQPDIEAPEVSQVERPTPDTQRPAPAPRVEAPAPPPPPVVVEAPAPPPPPVIEAPAPAPPPAMQEPPAAPPVQKPVLPRLSDLFPKKDRTGTSSGSDSGSSPATTLLPVPGDE